MGKAHPTELRARVVAFVEEGNIHRGAARQLRVSPRFVNNMVILKQASGALKPARQGHLSGGELTGHEDWVRARMAENGDLTLDELGVELLGAASRRSPERDLWINRRKRFFNTSLARLVFIDAKLRLTRS